jgi:hypothetical protein
VIDPQTCEFPNPLKTQGLRHFDLTGKTDLSLLWAEDGARRTVEKPVEQSSVGSGPGVGDLVARAGIGWTAPVCEAA